MFLRQRICAPEVMDDLSCSGDDLVKALKELDMINKWLGGEQITLTGIQNILKNAGWSSESPFFILDMGCGSGTQMKVVADWFRQKQIPVRLLGIDANPYIVQFAAENCTHYPEISFKTADVFDALPVQQPDLICATLFCHHFREQELLELVRKWHQKVTYAVLINDLHRHMLAYTSISFLTSVFSGSQMVRNDAPLSVKRGFSREELQNIFKEAGVLRYSVSWKWAFRYQAVAWKG